LTTDFTYSSLVSFWRQNEKLNSAHYHVHRKEQEKKRNNACSVQLYSDTSYGCVSEQFIAAL